MTNARIEVKRMTAEGSKNWGVYVNGRLLEGGFFSRETASECAQDYARDTDTRGG